jgi:hypothetical protein
MGETKSMVSMRNEIPRIKWNLNWRDGDYSLEGTVRKVKSMYVFAPAYINGHFMYRDTDSGPIFRSKTQWDCVIEAIEYAYDYSIFKPRLKVEEQKKWWQLWKAESFNPHVVQKSRKATRFTPSSKLRTGAFRTKEEAQEYRKLLKNKGHGKFGQSLRVVKANKYDPFMETFGKNAKGEYFRDWQAESFGAEGDYEPSFDSLEERIEWMEFAVNDKFLHQYEDDYSNVVLDIEEWNENNGNNSKLSNLVKQYKNKTGWMDAESFSADNYYSRNYRGFEIDKEGDEKQAFYYITKGNNRIEMELVKGVDGRKRRGDTYNYASYFYGNYPHTAEKMFETFDEALNWFDEQIDNGRMFKDFKAESFNSYKVAPDLSSYTKAELVSSIAGPQGTAAYDEVVYDPVAQSRLSAESIDSFSPARLIVLGASIGVALGLYNTRRD